MTYLTCTKHRSFQRKHIDVCRQCPDSDGCDAFQAYAATEPPPAPEPTAAKVPLRLVLTELENIRELLEDTLPSTEADRAPRQKKHLQGTQLMAFIRSELEGIKKLC